MIDPTRSEKHLRSQVENLQKAVNELSTLNDLAQAISSTLDPQEIMALIIQKAVETIGVEQGSIHLLEEDPTSPLKTVVRAVDPGFRGPILRLGEYLTGWVLHHDGPLLVNEVTQEPGLKEFHLEKSGLRSLLCVPMQVQGRLIGILALFNKRSDLAFTPDDQRLLSIIATQVGTYLENARLYDALKQARDRLEAENVQLKRQVGVRYGFEGIVGKHPTMLNIIEEVKAFAATSASGLLCGETGTGKELFARTIHHNSPRRHRPFVDINAAALTESLLESELFGIEEGVATGVKRRLGLLEQADGGTLFIDEISSMSPSAQAKILRALEEKRFRRVGGDRPIAVDVRILAATNKDLKREIEKGTFREDLYYRLSVFEITLPALRERREDIPLLCAHFLGEFCHAMAKPLKTLAPEVEEVFMNYSWPGNVRELANVIERAVILSRSPYIGIEHLPPDMVARRSVLAQGSWDEALNHFKRRAVERALRDTGYHRGEAARRLGISRQHLRNLMAQFELGGVRRKKKSA